MSLSFNDVLSVAALLICCGAVFILVKMLLKNTIQQEKFFNALGKCHTELESSSKKLDTISAILERRFNNMIEDTSKRTDPVLLDTIHKFEKLSLEISDRLDGLLLPSPRNADYAIPNETIIEELAKLQGHLELLSDQLRRNNYLSVNENAEISAMKKRIESYQSMVMKARSEAKESEAMMADLKDEIQKLRANRTITTITETEASDEIKRLQQLMNDMTREKQTLEAKLVTLNDEMKRNNIEKKFIEDRFIDMS